MERKTQNAIDVAAHRERLKRRQEALNLLAAAIKFVRVRDDDGKVIGISIKFVFGLADAKHFQELCVLAGVEAEDLYEAVADSGRVEALRMNQKMRAKARGGREIVGTRDQ